ncbi:MAG: hypothetical protein M1835_005285 [Candelina submexicana]|nr:MAG: hypothetical protein M1835_005285 [Candelina submexicana]
MPFPSRATGSKRLVEAYKSQSTSSRNEHHPSDPALKEPTSAVKTEHSPSRLPVSSAPSRLHKPNDLKGGDRRASLLPQRSRLLKDRQSTASTSGWPSKTQKSLSRSDQDAASGVLPDVLTDGESQQAVGTFEDTLVAIEHDSRAIEESELGSNAQPSNEACLGDESRAPMIPKLAQQKPMGPPSTTSKSQRLQKPATFGGASKGTHSTKQMSPKRIITQSKSSKGGTRLDSSLRRNSSASNKSAESNYPTDGHTHNGLSSSGNVIGSSSRANSKLPGLRVTSNKVDSQINQAHIMSSDITSVGRGASTKPAFSALQQHFSPKKPTKLPASSWVPPSPLKQSGNIPMLAPIVRLQTELLQLHLMHMSSATMQRQWEDSAELNLKQHFEDVRAMYWKSHIARQKAQERINIEALKEWLSHNTGLGSSEKIQILGSSVQDIYGTVDVNGRLAQLVKTFTRWIDTVQRIWQARSDQRVGQIDLEIVEGLGEDWKADCITISRKMHTYLKSSERLPIPVDGSSLATIMKVSQSLGASVIEELDIMQTTERQIVKDETAWIEESISLLVNHKLGVVQSHRKGVWQAHYLH